MLKTLYINKFLLKKYLIFDLERLDIFGWITYNSKISSCLRHLGVTFSYCESFALSFGDGWGLSFTKNRDRGKRNARFRVESGLRWLTGNGEVARVRWNKKHQGKESES